MKRVLMIFSRPPYPLIGGDKIRMYQDIKNLSTQYNIDVLFINDVKTDPEIIEKLNFFSNNIYNFDFKKRDFYFNTLFGYLFNNKPLQVNYYYFKIIQKWIDDNIQNYDAVFCSSIRTSEYVYNKDIFKIIDFIDAISMNYEKAYHKSRFGLWKLLYKIDMKRLIKYEKAMVKFFHQKLIISDIDRNFISGNQIVQNFDVLPNSVEIDNALQSLSKEENYILFVGKMDYEPNISAVNYFSKKVFPSLTRAIPDLKFYIVGVKPKASVKKLAERNSNIIVTGYVKNINRLILNSKLVVAPMISGAGIQNKILLAMSLRKCVVTTPLGAEGLNAFNKEVVVCNSSNEMIENILSLLTNERERNEIGERGFEFVKNNFSEIAIRKQLLEFISI